jgi:hypothetical protein
MIMYCELERTRDGNDNVVYCLALLDPYFIVRKTPSLNPDLGKHLIHCT